MHVFVFIASSLNFIHELKKKKFKNIKVWNQLREFNFYEKKEQKSGKTRKVRVLYSFGIRWTCYLAKMKCWNFEQIYEFDKPKKKIL